MGTGGRVDFPCGCSARAVAVPVCVPVSGVPQVLGGTVRGDLTVRLEIQQLETTNT